MRNIKLEIEYNGKNYCGWQAQNHSSRNKPSIQRTIENALSKLLQENIKLIGSGRTDAGVHALAQTANFKTKTSLSPERMRLGINALLPGDIAVVRVKDVGIEFNSRFFAKSKLYRYTVLNRTYRTALSRDYCFLFPHRLDINLMRRQAKDLLGKHNFKAFQATEFKEKNPIKTIKRLKVTKDGDNIYIDIEADGFLYNMVRNIVGTLLEIGRGKLKKGGLKEILYSCNRKSAGPKVPAKGLCLLKVNY